MSTGTVFDTRNHGLGDLRSTDWVYLVELGPYRLASQGVSVAVDGSDVFFEPASVEVIRDRELNYRTLTHSETVSVELYLPDASLLTSLDLLEVRVSRIRSGAAYEAREEIANGYVIDPQVSSIDEPVRFAVSATIMLEDDRTPLPVRNMDDLYTVDDLPEKSKSEPIPWFYGRPGLGALTVACPVAEVSWLGGIRTTKVQISSNKLAAGFEAASAITWYRSDEPHPEINTFGGSSTLVSNTRDGGAYINIVDGGLTDTSIDDPATYYIGFNADAATLPIDTANGSQGLGNLLRYCCGIMSIPIDWQAMSATLQDLDTYLVDTWVDDEAANVYDWVASMGDVFGFAWAQSTRGAFIVARPSRVGFDVVEMELVAGVDVVRTTELSSETGDPLTFLELQYGQRVSVTGITNTIKLPGRYNSSEPVAVIDLPAGVNVTETYYGAASASLSPYQDGNEAQTEVMEAHFIADDATASRVVNNQLYWRAFPTRSFQIEALTQGGPLDVLGLGSLVQYTDADLGLTEELAYVSGISETNTDRVITLTLIVT